MIRDFHDRMVYRLRSWIRTRDSTPDPRPGELEEWTDKDDPYPRVRNGHGREPVDEDGRTP